MRPYGLFWCIFIASIVVIHLAGCGSETKSKLAPRQPAGEDTTTMEVVPNSDGTAYRLNHSGEVWHVFDASMVKVDFPDMPDVSYYLGRAAGEPFITKIVPVVKGKAYAFSMDGLFLLEGYRATRVTPYQTGEQKQRKAAEERTIERYIQ